MRIIYIDVCGFELRQSSKSGGVQGEKNATVLQIKFDDSWSGLGKRIVWRDATGENPTPVVLFDPMGIFNESAGAEQMGSAAEPVVDELSYATAIPAAALAYPGWCSFTIEGYTMRDGHTVKAMGAVGALEVHASEVFYQPEDAEASETEQILTALGKAETKMVEIGNAAKANRTEAKSWAVGGTGSREGEDTDNAMYYAGKAAEDAEKAVDAATDAEAAQSGAKAAAATSASAKAEALEAKTAAVNAKSAAEVAATVASGAKTDALAAKTAALGAQEAAETAASGALASQTGAAESAAASAISAVSAAESAAAAQTAQASAEAAKTAAETARDEANTAKEEAVGLRNETEAIRQSAEETVKTASEAAVEYAVALTAASIAEAQTAAAEARAGAEEARNAVDSMEQVHEELAQSITDVHIEAFSARSTADAALATAEEALSGGGIVLGTEEHPYQISTAAELYDVLHNQPGKYYVMTGDIDCRSIEDWVPVGTTTTPYTGNFDGQGFTISGLRSNKDVNGAIYTGFIGVNGGVIKNVRFADVDMVGGNSGVAAGMNRGTISNVAVATGTVVGVYAAGGVAADNSGTIENCYNRASVSSSSNAGGIAAYNSNGGTIRNVYNAGRILGSGKYTGSIAVGNSGQETLISGAVCLIPETLLANGTTGAIEKSGMIEQQQLQSESAIQSVTENQWNFETTWEIPGEGMYPELRIIHTTEQRPEHRPSGTAEDPYVIMDCVGISNIRNAPDKHFVVGANIQFLGYIEPIPEFSGHLDGLYYKIQGLKLGTGITSPDGDSGKLYSAIFAVNKGEIKNVMIDGAITVTADNTYVSTLAGINKGTIERCATYSGSLDNGYAAGGIAAVNEGTIRDVYNRMMIKHGTTVGGIVAENRAGGSIEHAFVMATLSSGKSGNIAYSNNGDISGSFAQYGSPLVKDTGTGYIAPVESALKWERELKKQSTYTEISKPWDFTNVWTTQEDTTVPNFIGFLAKQAEITAAEQAAKTPAEEAQQAITELELASIEQGQQITDLELMVLGGMANA